MSSTPSSSTWVLILRDVSLEDAGKYECQLSSSPKLSSWINLRVLVPRVEITGPPDKFVTAGSDVSIECVTSNIINKPSFVTWIFNGKVNREVPLVDRVNINQVGS